MVIQAQTPETTIPAALMGEWEVVSDDYSFGVEDYELRITSPEAYLGAVGTLATLMDLPEAREYQEQYEQREISTASFLARMAHEAVERQAAQHPKFASFISRLISGRSQGAHAQPDYTPRHA